MGGGFCRDEICRYIDVSPRGGASPSPLFSAVRVYVKKTVKMTVDCGPNCDFYVYRPNLGANVTLLALFALLLPVVLFLGIHYRTPGFSATLAAGILVEILGFAGRILLHSARGHEAFFALSLFGTVLGPTCASAALVLVLTHLFSIYGERFAPCRPMLASLILHGLVAAALAVQVVGIGLLSRNFHSLAVFIMLLIFLVVC